MNLQKIMNIEVPQIDIAAWDVSMAIGAGALGVYLLTGFYLVPNPERWVIELNIPFLKSRQFVWDPGIHFLWIPKSKVMRIREKLYCGEQETIITIGEDDKNPGGKGLVEFADTSAKVKVQLITKVIDPKKATYNVAGANEGDDYLSVTANLIEAALRRKFSSFILDDAMKNEARSEADQEIFLSLKETLDNWGVEIINVAIIDFDLPDEIRKQRDRIQAAEKEKQASITVAQGQAQARMILAGGEAEAMKKVASGEATAEFTKINKIATKFKQTPEQVMAYLLTGKLMGAMEASTLILSSSKTGTLNMPQFDLMATMIAMQQAMTKNTQKPGETREE